MENLTFLVDLKQKIFKLVAITKSRQFLILLIIIGLGAYLRIWDISVWFNSLHDSEEGVYSIGARLITQGSIPYKNFFLAHPPLHELVLAGVYKFFGYSFYFGRYLSIVLSLASIIFVYIIGRKLYNPGVGTLAALLFAISPEIVYWGRSVEPEALGIFLLILAIYSACKYTTGRQSRWLFFCGLLLGLTASTKYTFIPGVAAVTIIILLNRLDNIFFKTINFLKKPSFWLTYVSFVVFLLLMFFVIKWILNIQISIPLIDISNISSTDYLGFFFLILVPLMITLCFFKMTTRTIFALSLLWRALDRRVAYVLLPGILIGFLGITGFFIWSDLKLFFHQTFLVQVSQGSFQFPSLLSLIVNIFSPGDFTKISLFLILLAPVVSVVMLLRQPLKMGDLLISFGLLTIFFFCQWLNPAPRYYVSVYPFLIIGISTFLTFDTKSLKNKLQNLNNGIKTKLISVFMIIALFLTSSLLVLIKNPVYDVGTLHSYSSDEDRIYSDTIKYLDSVGAKQICSPNPIIPALSNNLSTSNNIDFYALRYFENVDPTVIIQSEYNLGTDYIVLDHWFRFWQSSWTQAMKQTIFNNSRLVAIIPSCSNRYVEVYWLKAPTTGIINGEFNNWVNNGNINAPFGWLPMISSQNATMDVSFKPGERSIELKIGAAIQKSDPSYVQLIQSLPFPKGHLIFRLLPNQNSKIVDANITGPSIRFLDSENHVLDLCFSDKVSFDTNTLSSDGNRMILSKKTNLGNWQEYVVDLNEYWQEANWGKPDNILINLNLISDISEDSEFTFYISRIEED
jgi:hypothetical protein